MARLQPGMRTLELQVRRNADQRKAAIAVANFHRSAVIEVRASNRAIAGGGGDPSREVTTVDGRRGAPLESVKLDGGTISTLFPFSVAEILEYIDYLLITRSPVGPTGGAGTYQRSHRLFADGTETDPAHPKLDASEWVFTSNLPYARKIEFGQGRAPKEGVYQGAAKLANQKFGNIARIRFTYEAIAPGAGSTLSRRQLAYPAIRIRLL
jgi:hypothetical protein